MIPDGRTCLAAFHALAALMGFAFFVIVWSGGSPVSPELYGEAVYAIPAIVWGLTQMSLGATVTATMLARKPVALSIASFLSMLYYAALGSLAIRADQGTLVAIGAFFIMLPPSVLTCWLAKELGRGA